MPCPICAKSPDTRYRPFCSRRCADVDLARWLNGSYAVPSTDPEDAERAAEEVAEKTAEKAAEKAAAEDPRLH